MADRIGHHLGNYHLLRLLGEGSFADVYLGEHIYLKTQAAIKVLRTRLGRDELAGFLGEAQIIARLKHPQIVRVLDFGVEAGTPFLVMEYAPGGTLRQRHPKDQALPLLLIRSYVRQVSEALQYAHEQQLVHRDVKPENMLLGERDAVLLSDFGIATVAQSSRYQHTEGVAGTAAYMAPEQFQGFPRPASDQYALGVVVYEWLTGKRPFQGSFLEISGQHLHQPPPPLREKRPAIPPALEEVVLTALAKDPRERFGSIRTFATAFASACQEARELPEPLPLPGQEGQALPAWIMAPTPGLPPTPPQQDERSTRVETSQVAVLPPEALPPPDRSQDARGGSSPFAELPLPPPEPILPPPMPQPPEQSPRRLSRRVVVVGLAGLVAVGGGATALALTQHGSGTTSMVSATPTIGPTATTTPDLGTTRWLVYTQHTDLVSSVAWSPDNQRIVSASYDTTVQIWNPYSGSTSAFYRDHRTPVDSVSWSLDGIHLASAAETVRVWEDSGLQTIIVQPTGERAVAWSPNGKRLVYGTLVWDLATQQTVFGYQGALTAPTNALAWSPDGTRIASGGGDYSNPNVDHAVQVWSARDGTPLFIYRGHSLPVTAVSWSPDGSRIASGSVDGTVQVWDAADGGHVFTYHGHLGEVFAVAWSLNNRIASGSGDGTVRVWDGPTGDDLFIYRGHSRGVYAVAWSSDSARIASGGADRTVQVWQVP